MLNGKVVEIQVGGDYDVIPMDKYTTQIVDVDLIEVNKWQSLEKEEVLNFKFVILDEKEIEGEGGKISSTRGRFLWHKIRLVYGKTSWLVKLAKAVLGREVSKEEVQKMDFDSLVGKQVDVMTENKESKEGDRTYTNIKIFSTTKKELKPLGDTAQAAVVKKTTVPATAPKEDAQEFLGNLKKEAEKTEDGLQPAGEVLDELSEEEKLERDIAALNAKKKALEAKRTASK